VINRVKWFVAIQLFFIDKAGNQPEEKKGKVPKKPQQRQQQKNQKKETKGPAKVDPAGVKKAKEKMPQKQRMQKNGKPQEVEKKDDEKEDDPTGTRLFAPLSVISNRNIRCFVLDADVVDLQKSKKLRKLRKTEDETEIDVKDYEKRLRNQFLKMHPNQHWATKGNDEDEDEEGGLNILQTTKSLFRKSEVLSSEVLSFSRVRDANQQGPSESVVQCVAFHKNGRVLMTAGYDKTLRLFQIDGRVNEQVQNVFIDRMPIHTARFSAEGTSVIASGRRKFFYIFNIDTGKVDQVPWIQGFEGKSLERFEVSPCGNFLVFLAPNGYLVLVSAKTRQWLANLKMNGTVNSVAFTPDKAFMFSFGGDGEVYKWDLRMRKCVQRFKDEGCVHGLVITVSPNGHYLACGSDSGVVNLYDLQGMDPTTTTPKPLKSFLNITTPITDIKFNHDSQILGFSSDQKPNALRLVHVASRTAFSNFPPPKTPLGSVFCFDFSPSSGYLVVGNDKGRALLFRLNHYPSV